MTWRVLAIAEDALGFTLARDLCDRVVVERGPDWLQENWRKFPDALRVWRGVEGTDAWTTWSRVAHHDRPGRSAHGLGMKGYALVAYRVAHLAARMDPRPDVVVLCLDTQGRDTLRDEMLAGLARAKVDDVPFVLAVAHQESEAWMIAGFTVESAVEGAALHAQVRHHGFDPTREPHRLTPNRPTYPHDAKRTAAALLPTGASSERAQRCWRVTPLDDLEHLGRLTGLADYTADVERVVLPLLTGMPASARDR